MAHFVKQLLQPVAMVWLVLILMMAWNLYRRKFWWAAIHGLMVFGLSLFGSTPLPGWLLAGLEKPYVNACWADAREADAIIVLGGYLTDGQKKEPAGFDVSQHFDRLLAGIEIVRRSKAKCLVLGGGSIPQEGKFVSEYDLIKPWLDQAGLGDTAIKHLGICANTNEEARRVKVLMNNNNWETVCLVTSAWHMRRARGAFESAGVQVIPVACDFTGFYRAPDSGLLEHFTLLPQSGRLNMMRIYLHEQVGWLYYRSRGWIKPGK
jgi:uncharacterized SAM-binding protein YcdF (DUF218 family)